MEKQGENWSRRGKLGGRQFFNRAELSEKPSFQNNNEIGFYRQTISCTDHSGLNLLKVWVCKMCDIAQKRIYVQADLLTGSTLDCVFHKRKITHFTVHLNDYTVWHVSVKKCKIAGGVDTERWIYHQQCDLLNLCINIFPPLGDKTFILLSFLEIVSVTHNCIS